MSGKSSLFSRAIELVRDSNEGYAEHIRFSTRRGSKPKIDAWVRKSWIGDDAPGSRIAGIDARFEANDRRDRHFLRENETMFRLRIRKQLSTRPVYVSEEKDEIGKPVISGVYLPASALGDPPYSLRLFLSNCRYDLSILMEATD